MNRGRQLGGPVANPIREMLETKKSDGVIFDCYDTKKAENTRYAALMLKKRNGYNYKTMRRGSVLTIYKENADPYELRGANKIYFREEAYDNED